MRLATLLIFSLLCFLLTGYSDFNPNKRYYSDGHFYYEFYINRSNKKIKHKKQATYYWYKSGKIYTNFNDYDGNFLHGMFQKKKLVSKELVEKGFFKYGLKDGIWKNWYVNGNLEQIANWHNGFLDGKYSTFDKNGKLLIKGNYTNGKKDGKWVDFTKSDTLTYNKGKLVIKKKHTKKPFFKRIFKKKNTKNTSNKQVYPKKEKSFWKSIFKKKNKTTKVKKSNSKK